MSTQSEKLTAIANAIRAKEGSSGLIPANDFPERIAAIETGIQLPTLTNPGAAADLANGKQLIDQNGEIITGCVRTTESGSLVILGGDFVTYGYWTDPSQVNHYQVSIRGTVTSTYGNLLRNGSEFQVSRPAEEFGNATAADVAAGKTFTSTAGVKVTGTAASMPAMATVTVNIGSTSWTNTDIFAPFDYLSIGSLPFDPSAAQVSSPATFQVPVGGAFGIAAGAGGIKPISITGGRIIVDSEGTDGCHYSMIVVESTSCYITMGLT